MKNKNKLNTPDKEPRRAVVEVVFRIEMEIEDELLPVNEVVEEFAKNLDTEGTIAHTLFTPKGTSVRSVDAGLIQGSYQTLIEGGEYPMIEEHTNFKSVYDKRGEWQGFEYESA